MAKVHLETGRFGKAACGKENVDTTTDLTLVTCERCEATEAFSETPLNHEHEWTQLWDEGPEAINPDGTVERVPVMAGAACECGATLTQAQWSARSPS